MTEEKQVAADKSASGSEKRTDNTITDKNPEDKAVREPVKRGSFTTALTFIFSLVALAAVGSLGYFAYLQSEQFTQRLATLEQQELSRKNIADQQNDKLQTNLAQFQKQLVETLNQQHSQFKQKAEQRSVNVAEQLLITQRKIQAVAGRHQSDWLLAEADYLIRLATNRLLLEQDHVTALALLKNADERIQLMDDPSLQKARTALATDITQLRALKKVDTAGLAIRMSVLAVQLKTLPMINFQLPEEKIKQLAETTSTDDDWYTNLKQTFKELSVKWFEVRDHGQKVLPLMTLNDEKLIRNNLSMLMQNAQYSILHSNELLYQNSLKQLKEMANKYFETINPELIAFVAELDDLSKMPVSVEFPATLSSRLIISRELDLRLNKNAGGKQ